VNTQSAVFWLELEEFLNSDPKILNHCWLKESSLRIFIPFACHFSEIKAVLPPAPARNSMLS